MKQNKKTTEINNFKNFIFSVYNAESLKFLFSFILAAFAAVLVLTTLYSVFRQRNNEEVVITSNIITDNCSLIKGWELTSDLKSAIEAGDISLKDITVIEEGGEITFSGGDSDKITIVNYKTVIEDNKNPQIYSDKYFEKLCREGKNVYVVKTLGLATEAKTNEGAE